MVVVGDRCQDTLCRLILRHILPGTHVLSNGWAGYYKTLGRYHPRTDRFGLQDPTRTC